MAIFKSKNKIKFAQSDATTLNDIKVVGVGGGGGNTVNHMFNNEVKCVDFAICNTDGQALGDSPVLQKLQLGPMTTRGKGAGSKPHIGVDAANESIDDIRALFPDRTEMVFVTAGMGGGTGTGAAPIVAKEALDAGKLTLGIVTTPFSFEGRDEVAAQGLAQMKESVDSLIVIDNDKIFDAYEDVNFDQCFAMVNQVLNDVASSIADIVTRALKVNVDMNDMKTLLKGSRTAMLGTGRGCGENKAKDALQEVFSSPFMSDVNVYDSTGFIFVVKYGRNGFPSKVMKDITTGMREKVGPKPQCIKWGYGYDPELEDDQIEVIFITAGFPESKIDKKSIVESVSQHKTLPIDLPINGISPEPIIGRSFRREMRGDVEYTIYSLSCDEGIYTTVTAYNSSSSTASTISDRTAHNQLSPLDATIEQVFARPVTQMHITQKKNERINSSRNSDAAYTRMGLRITINPPLEGRTNTYVIK